MHVHAPQAGHNGGHREDNGHGGQQLHHNVQVVGNHGSKGIHGAGQNVPVDAAHLHSLLVLDDYILQKIGILGEIPHKVHAQQLLQNDLVALQGGGEVHQALFQAQHLNELLVLHALVQLVLHAGAGLVHLTQVEQEQAGVAVEHLQSHALALFGAACLDQAFHEGAGQRGLLQRHGDDVILGEHDAEGNGGVYEAVALGLHDGGIHDDEDVAVVLHLNTAAFLFIQRGPNQIRIHMQLGADPADFLLVGVTQIDPGTGQDLILLQHTATVAQINIQHKNTPAFSNVPALWPARFAAHGITAAPEKQVLRR